MYSFMHVTFAWPEDPSWPDPSGNDPYDIAG